MTTSLVWQHNNRNNVYQKQLALRYSIVNCFCTNSWHLQTLQISLLLFCFKSKSKLLTYCFKICNKTMDIFRPITFSYFVKWRKCLTSTSVFGDGHISTQSRCRVTNIGTFIILHALADSSDFGLPQNVSFPSQDDDNHRAKFDAANFILSREIRIRTNTQKTVTDISAPCLCG